ncbi:MAG: ferritin-like domain-containing protein, partial [Clostridiales bacterium]|nr:ferritin-like domain-containing protein [Clostridiales bacterium]
MITNVALSTKEKLLLQDQKSHEEQCIMKYDNYANLATDSELKTIFRNISQKEKEHLQTVNQLLNGQVPSMAGQSQLGSQQQNQAQANPMPMSQQTSIDQAGKTG